MTPPCSLIPSLFRRANYIATLEETGQLPHPPFSLHLLAHESPYPVTSLESVVLQLQDSCREARQEAGELKQDNARLKHELREREKFWRALWQARKTGQAPESDDLPPLPATFSPHTPSNIMSNRLPTSHGSHYSDDGMNFQTNDDAASLCNGAYGPPNHSYPAHSPSLSYPGVDTDHLPAAGPTPQLGANRVSKFGQYPYSVQPMNRDAVWAQNVPQTSSSSGKLHPTANLITPDLIIRVTHVDLARYVCESLLRRRTKNTFESLGNNPLPFPG